VALVVSLLEFELPTVCARRRAGSRRKQVRRGVCNQIATRQMRIAL